MISCPATSATSNFIFYCSSRAPGITRFEDRGQKANGGIKRTVSSAAARVEQSRPSVRGSGSILIKPSHACPRSAVLPRLPAAARPLPTSTSYIAGRSILPASRFSSPRYPNKPEPFDRRARALSSSFRLFLLRNRKRRRAICELQFRCLTLTRCAALA